MPMAEARSGLFLIARRDRPNGECTMRRASRNSRNSTIRQYQKPVLPNMSKANIPRIGCISMPCSPSVPPVMLEKRSPSASIKSAMPSVTISRVRSTPRMTRKLVKKPSTIAARPATINDDRLSDDSMQRKQPRRIGADAEESGVAERDDAGIAQDQVERQREQRQPQDVGHDQRARWKGEGAGQHQQPESGLAGAPTARGHRRGGDVVRRAHDITARRCGRTGRWDARSGSRS